VSPIDGVEAQLRDLALEAARAAAALIRERRTHEVRVADTKSSPTDVVTQADRDSEALIRSLITARRPHDGFLGEEGGTTGGTSGVRWIIDPIDGTVNFLYGLPQYAVSIAAEVEGDVVAGVVLNAATGVEYVATPGDPRRDGVPISVADPTPLDRRLVITGFSYEVAKRTVQAEAVARLLPVVRDVRRLGSSALDLCYVADGKADAYVEEGVHLWDYAAGGFIATQAGARATILRGAYGTPAMVAAPAHGYDEFLAAVTAAGFLTVETSSSRPLEDGPFAT
jgi:myo-inositol-1(or 4)-monophosphatase